MLCLIFMLKRNFAILNCINFGLIFHFTIIASFLLLTVYFKIADKFNIIDKPKNRSSHSELTIRGAGVVFPVRGIIGFGAGAFLVF